MLIYAGIDEAGYGPMLGPLCIGMSAFLLERHNEGETPPDLWETLREGVCVSPRDKRRRIAVADSKRLKGASNSKSHPLRHLERGVLAFTGAIDGTSVLSSLDDASLLGRFGADLPTALSTPWYKSVTSLPVAHDPDMLSISSARLRTTMDQAGVRPLVLGCTSIDAGELNRQLAEGDSKAKINQNAILGLVARVRVIAAEVGETTPRIVIDRQGGRTFYSDWITSCLPNSRVKILGENERISRYEVHDDKGAMVLSFETGAETRHFPVALASMVAKYTRELAMIRLNRFFAERLPQLKPTAGYVQDGRRFMKEVKPVVDSLELDQQHLVRTA